MSILFVILILCIAVLGGVLVVFDSWNDRLWKENRALRKELERAKRADGEWQGTADGYADGNRDGRSGRAARVLPLLWGENGLLGGVRLWTNGQSFLLRGWLQGL